jgi:uncharacterized protein YceH (UPF0502 family)
MHHFGDLEELVSTLHRMMEFSPSLVKMLPRHPGTKESRYVHLLSGDVENWATPVSSPEQFLQRDTASAERIAALEAQVAVLENDVAELKRQVAGWTRQSE